MDGQDWNPITINRTSSKHAQTARTHGAALIRHLETEEIPKPTKKLSSDSRNAMIRSRTGKSMTQAQVNAACALPLNTIRDIENGKLCPSPTQMNVIARLFGIIMKYE